MITKNKSYPAYKDSKVSWIGEIPSDWGTSKLKFQTNINKNNLAENTDPFYEIQYVDIGNVDSNGQIGELQKYYFEQAPSRARRIVRNGDTLISTVRTYLKAITSVKEAPSNLICSTGFVVLTPDKAIDSLYLSYLVRSDIYVDEIVSRSVGVSYPAINASEIGDLECILPDLKTQEKIGEFLEKESNDIKDLINGKQKLIELLEEKRQSMITEAVTKGLNPNVKMKGSGVEWIGEIPEHWDTISVRNLLRNNIIEYQDGNHGELHPISDDYIEEGIPFIMANNVRNNKLDLSHCKYISQERAEKLRIGFSVSGDVLLTHKGTVGEVAIVPDTLPSSFIMLTPQVTYYRIKKSNVIKNVFLGYFFQSHSFKNQLKIISSMQSTRQYVGLVAQRELIVILPTIDEQQEIVKMISETEKPIKKIMADISLQIDKLKEYRQSLIYEAVTGKIDVRDFEVKA